MSSKIEKGWAIYKSGKVKLVDVLDGLLTFHVQGSRNQVYIVTCYDDDWNCQCLDFFNRHARKDLCFHCKHIYACIFELAEIKREHPKMEIMEIFHEKEAIVC